MLLSSASGRSLMYIEKRSGPTLGNSISNTFNIRYVPIHLTALLSPIKMGSEPLKFNTPYAIK